MNPAGIVDQNLAPEARALGRYRQLRKEGRLEEALVRLRQDIPFLGANEVAQAGRMLLKDLSTAFPGGRSPQVLILGQCTTNYLPPVVTAWAWADGMQVSVRDGAHDQMLQELMALTTAPDVIVLLPWHQRLLADDARPPGRRVADEVEFLRAAWAQVARLKSKLVQVAYDWTGPGAAGYALSGRDGTVALVHEANAAVRAALPAQAFFVDLESFSAMAGKLTFYDARNEHWLKQPFSPLGLSILARHLATAVRTLTSGRRKVLVLDLDNTLWGGVVGDTGPLGIAVGGEGEGAAYLAFQKHVSRLRDMGVLLAACSKNNADDAREPFEKNDRMHLALGDFAAFHASWDAKPEGLRRIASELNLGLDSLVFFDDNPAERAQVRAALPEVTVVDVPAEPAHYIRALEESLAFETAGVTEADSQRGVQYAAESRRKSFLSAAASPDDYLASLEMEAEVLEIGPANLDRVVDLVTKTNQFNLTTRRHSRAAVEEMVATARSVCFAVRLSDRFGDYGIVSVVLATALDATTLRLDTWLMSCRAMGRTLEHFVFNRLTALARQTGYERILAEYLPTPKNVPVQRLLPDFGFARGDQASQWILPLTFPADLATRVCPSRTPQS
jgi:FkbH-like protein